MMAEYWSLGRRSELVKAPHGSNKQVRNLQNAEPSDFGGTWLIILEFSGPETSKMLSQVISAGLGSSFWSFQDPKPPKC